MRRLTLILSIKHDTSSLTSAESVKCREDRPAPGPGQHRQADSPAAKLGLKPGDKIKLGQMVLVLLLVRMVVILKYHKLETLY